MRAEATDCPYLLNFSSSSHTAYVATFASPFASSPTIEATFYTATDSYKTAPFTIAITQPDPMAHFVSERVRFTTPAPASFESIELTVHLVDGTTCANVSVLKDSVGAGEGATDGAAPAPVAIAYVRAEPPLSCPKAYDDAHFAGAPAPPAYPRIAREQGLTGTVLVKVSLGADSSVSGVAIYRSSGSALLDESALIAAKTTRYSTTIFRCRPVSGTFLYRADFAGG